MKTESGLITSRNQQLRFDYLSRLEILLMSQNVVQQTPFMILFEGKNDRGLESSQMLKMTFAYRRTAFALDIEDIILTKRIDGLDQQLVEIDEETSWKRYRICVMCQCRVYGSLQYAFQSSKSSKSRH